MSQNENHLAPWSIARWADRTASPWKNGGGVTTQLAAHPTGARIDDFEWRVSVAQVDRPNAFSVFPGVDRIIMLVEGGRMVLTVDGAHVPLSHHVPFSFRGEDTVSCAVPDGSTRDLNVMTRRTGARAKLSVCAAGEQPQRVSTTATCLIIALEAVLQISTPGAPCRELRRFDVVQAPPGAEECPIEGIGHYALVEIESSTQDH